MAFIISGDIHGTLDIGKLVKFFDEHEGEYNSDDYLIICGDVGMTKAEMWSKFFSKGKPYRRYAYACNTADDGGNGIYAAGGRNTESTRMYS